MPLGVCRALGITPADSQKKVTQLDRTEVSVVGELNMIQMQIASDPRIQQVINIQVADIPDAYGLILGRDFTRALNGYVSTDHSHMWLPWKGVPNQIRIEREPRMKYMTTEYQKTSTEVLISEVGMGNYMLST